MNFTAAIIEYPFDFPESSPTIVRIAETGKAAAILAPLHLLCIVVQLQREFVDGSLILSWCDPACVAHVPCSAVQTLSCRPV
jgi:hypothetical protein